jgi:hypothetical protein
MQSSVVSVAVENTKKGRTEQNNSRYHDNNVPVECEIGGGLPEAQIMMVLHTHTRYIYSASAVAPLISGDIQHTVVNELISKIKARASLHLHGTIYSEITC